MEERRKFMRFDASVDVNYGVPEMGIKGPSLSKNFSREGMGLSIDRSLFPETILELEIRIPGEFAPIFATAEVVWMRKTDGKAGGAFEAGVKFTEISALDKYRILDYVYKQWHSRVCKVEGTKRSE